VRYHPTPASALRQAKSLPAPVQAADGRLCQLRSHFPGLGRNRAPGCLGSDGPKRGPPSHVGF
jgi:hypothetical protein